MFTHEAIKTLGGMIILWITHGGLLFFLLFPQTISAADQGAPEEPSPPLENHIGWGGRIDTAHYAVSSRIISLARWMDSFFDDPEYATEEADARISISQATTYSKADLLEYRTRISSSVALPNLSRKTKLVFEGNEDLEVEDTEKSVQESAKESVDSPSIGLQYSFLELRDLDLRVRAGVRLGDPSFYAGPRIRAYIDIGNTWTARFTQRAYWYTDNYWRSKSTLDFDRIIGSRNLFRQSFRTDWKEEYFPTQGFRHTVTSSLSQPLKDAAAFRYSWSSVYYTRPNGEWSSTALSVSYRQSVWQDWILLEVTPFVAWEDRLNWEINPGITFSVNILFEDRELTPRPKLVLNR